MAEILVCQIQLGVLTFEMAKRAQSHNTTFAEEHNRLKHHGFKIPVVSRGNQREVVSIDFERAEKIFPSWIFKILEEFGKSEFIDDEQTVHYGPIDKAKKIQKVMDSILNDHVCEVFAKLEEQGCFFLADNGEVYISQSELLCCIHFTPKRGQEITKEGIQNHRTYVWGNIREMKPYYIETIEGSKINVGGEALSGREASMSYLTAKDAAEFLVRMTGKIMAEINSEDRDFDVYLGMIAETTMQAGANLDKNNQHIKDRSRFVINRRKKV